MCRANKDGATETKGSTLVTMQRKTPKMPRGPKSKKTGWLQRVHAPEPFAAEIHQMCLQGWHSSTRGLCSLPLSLLIFIVGLVRGSDENKEITSVATTKRKRGADATYSRGVYLTPP
jgi:hypothetical protein